MYNNVFGKYTSISVQLKLGIVLCYEEDVSAACEIMLHSQ